MTRPDASAARIVALLALSEEEPDLEELAEYLNDPAPEVRRTAIDVLTETTPPGVGTALARALADDDQTVRLAAADGLRELQQILEVDAAFHELLLAAGGSADPCIRETVVATLHGLKIGSREQFAAAVLDPSPDVRIAAVRGLVGLDATEDVERAAADLDREVRIAVARGLEALARPARLDTLVLLADDDEPLVAAAALDAAAAIGSPPPLVDRAVKTVEHAVWQVRRGAARALGAADPAHAVPSLLRLLEDVNIDVRKAAVQALARWADRHEVRTALAAAEHDPDADVRAYARRGLG